MVDLNPSSYPHIFDLIIEVAPHAALVALRAANRYLRDQVDWAMVEHIVIRHDDICTPEHNRIPYFYTHFHDTSKRPVLPRKDFLRHVHIVDFGKMPLSFATRGTEQLDYWYDAPTEAMSALLDALEPIRLVRRPANVLPPMSLACRTVVHNAMTFQSGHYPTEVIMWKATNTLKQVILCRPGEAMVFPPQIDILEGCRTVFVFLPPRKPYSARDAPWRPLFRCLSMTMVIANSLASSGFATTSSDLCGAVEIVNAKAWWDFFSPLWAKIRSHERFDADEEGLFEPARQCMPQGDVVLGLEQWFLQCLRHPGNWTTQWDEHEFVCPVEEFIKFRTLEDYKKELWDEEDGDRWFELETMADLDI